MEQQLGKALLVPVRPLVSASPFEHLGVEQGGVADSQLQVTKPLGLKRCFSSSSAVPGPRCYWAGGIGELGLGWGVQTGGRTLAGSRGSAATDKRLGSCSPCINIALSAFSHVLLCH